MKTKSRNRLILFITMSVIIFSQGINAQTEENNNLGVWKNKPWPISRFSAKLGGFWAISDTKLGVGTNNNPYSLIDFENDLGLNRHTTSLLFNFNARFGKRNRVDFSYYNIYRKASRTTDKDINFGDHTYPINSEIDTHLNTNIFRLSYGYAFISNPKWEVGGIFGFHIMSFGVGLDATGETQQLSLDNSQNFTVPLPDLGLWGTFAFHRNWAVSGEVGYFYVKVNNWDMDGRILTGNVSLQYRLSKHWNVDAGYTAFDVKANIDRKRLQAEFDWSYTGPTLAVAYRFGNR